MLIVTKLYIKYFTYMILSVNQLFIYCKNTTYNLITVIIRIYTN